MLIKKIKFCHNTIAVFFNICEKEECFFIDNENHQLQGIWPMLDLIGERLGEDVKINFFNSTVNLVKDFLRSNGIDITNKNIKEIYF